jgi:hypothetical protein
MQVLTAETSHDESFGAPRPVCRWLQHCLPSRALRQSISTGLAGSREGRTFQQPRVSAVAKRSATSTQCSNRDFGGGRRSRRRKGIAQRGSVFGIHVRKYPPFTDSPVFVLNNERMFPTRGYHHRCAGHCRHCQQRVIDRRIRDGMRIKYILRMFITRRPSLRRTGMRH